MRLAETQRQREKWCEKREGFRYVLTRGCCHGKARGWLYRNWTSYVVALGSMFGFLLLVLSWKQGKKTGKLAITAYVLIVSDPLLRNYCLASWAGYWRRCELEFYCYIWSGHCLCVYSISQMVFLEEDTGNTLDIWILLNQLKVQGKNILCIRHSICKNRILSMSWRIISSTHYINGAVVTLCGTYIIKF